MSAATFPTILQSLRPHLWVTGMFALVLALAIAIHGYYDSFLLFNTYLNTPWGDIIMPHLTNLGDGWLVYTLIIVLLWSRDPALCVLAILTAFIMGLFVQVLKNTAFEEWYRPPVYFEANPAAHILGKPLKRNSFPSGHTMSIITSGLFIAYGYRQLTLSLRILLSLFLCIVAYTRIYIGAHFPGDVLFSTLVGSAAGLLSIRLWHAPFRTWFGNISDRQHLILRWVMYSLAFLAALAGLWTLYG
jgi:undecaprenyl-diphosphatase